MSLRQLFSASRKAAEDAASLMLIASALIACAPGPVRQQAQPLPVESCDSLLARVVQLERTTDTSDAMDIDLDELGHRCPDDYEIAVDYISSVGLASESLLASCVELAEYRVRTEAIELLREDGLCESGTDPLPDAVLWPNSGLGWDVAKDHVGTSQRVCGPLASVRGSTDGVFVNVGQDYPNPERFTFVIWGDWWLDPVPEDATICGVGEIYLYEGVAQIELVAPSDLEIWE